MRHAAIALQCNRRKAGAFSSLALLLILFFSLSAFAQLDLIVIPPGSAEDKALQAISNEKDTKTKVAMYEEFVKKFSSNPMAVAYGNWQISESYQASGDLGKALSYGDKALESAPNNLEILVSQASIAQQMKNTPKLMEYAMRGGKAYKSAAKPPKPPGLTDEQFTAALEEAKVSSKSSYEFLETAAFNGIADEKDAKTRMEYLERFTDAFPVSRFDDQVTQYAMFTLGQLNDPARLLAYAEKKLAANPDSMPTMLMLANAYVDDARPESLGKAITYSEKVIAMAKAEAPDADRPRMFSAGVAHSILGYAYLKQEKAAAAIPELQLATGMLKGQDDVAYATALYRLGFAYGKTNRATEARTALEEAARIPGPLQKASQDLLNKVNAARPAKAK